MHSIVTTGRGSTVGALDLRILPFSMILYLDATIDETQISVSTVQMNTALGLSTEIYGIAAEIFFACRVVCEMPGVIVLLEIPRCCPRHRH